MLTFMALNGLTPSYLSELVSPYIPLHTLRSEGKNLFVEPKYRLYSFGGKAFSALAPRLWNSLQASLRNVRELSVFKAKLKTLLFKQQFGVWNDLLLTLGNAFEHWLKWWNVLYKLQFHSSYMPYTFKTTYSMDSPALYAVFKNFLHSNTSNVLLIIHYFISGIDFDCDSAMV